MDNRLTQLKKSLIISVVIVLVLAIQGSDRAYGFFPIPKSSPFYDFLFSNSQRKNCEIADCDGRDCITPDPCYGVRISDIKQELIDFYYKTKSRFEESPFEIPVVSVLFDEFLLPEYASLIARKSTWEDLVTVIVEDESLPEEIREFYFGMMFQILWGFNVDREVIAELRGKFPQCWFKQEPFYDPFTDYALRKRIFLMMVDKMRKYGDLKELARTLNFYRFSFSEYPEEIQEVYREIIAYVTPEWIEIRTDRGDLSIFRDFFTYCLDSEMLSPEDSSRTVSRVTQLEHKLKEIERKSQERVRREREEEWRNRKYNRIEARPLIQQELELLNQRRRDEGRI